MKKYDSLVLMLVIRKMVVASQVKNIGVEGILNSGERIPRKLCHGVSEQNTKKVLDGIGFLASSAARSFNSIQGK